MSGRTSLLLTRQVEQASRSEQPAPVSPVQSCPNKNWIELNYKYFSNTAVGGAEYKIFDLNGGQLACGKLDAMGHARVEGLPDGVTDVKFLFSGDPQPFKIFEQFKPKRNTEQRISVAKDEDFLDKLKRNAITAFVVYHQVNVAVGNWVLGAIAGDWSEDQTLGQILFDTVISLIPYVDQAADVRDITANLYQLVWKKKYDDFGTWFALVTTIIGCIPEVGTVIKGAVKSVLSVGIEGAKKLIAKTGIDIGTLIRFLNFFGEGNAVRWLREQVGKFDDYKKAVKSKIRQILHVLMFEIHQLKAKVFDKVAEFLHEVIKSIQQVLQRVDKFVDEIMNRARQEIDDLTKKAEDYWLRGKTQTPNGARQIAEQPPPLAPALERQKKFKAEMKEKAALAGMEPRELEGLVSHCKKTGRRVVVRFTNVKGLNWHGMEKYLPKPLSVKLKTAKSGDFAGLVVKPDPAKRGGAAIEQWELDNMAELEKNGFKFDEQTGVLMDKDGNKFYGDYDLQSVQREVIDAETGEKIHLNELTNPEDTDVVGEINSDMRFGEQLDPKQKPVQHGAEADNFVKVDDKGKIIEGEYGHQFRASEEEIMNKNAKLGRQYGNDEQYLVVNVEGKVDVLKNPEELYQLHQKKGDELPWLYEATPAEKAAAQTAK